MSDIAPLLFYPLIPKHRSIIQNKARSYDYKSVLL